MKVVFYSSVQFQPTTLTIEISARKDVGKHGMRKSRRTQKALEDRYSRALGLPAQA
jgi:hypothetical protein